MAVFGTFAWVRSAAWVTSYRSLPQRWLSLTALGRGSNNHCHSAHFPQSNSKPSSLAPLTASGAVNDTILQQAADDFARDGACCLRGVFTEWLPTIERGIDELRANPGPYFAENVQPQHGETGSFWDDYCNWTRIAPFEQLVWHSPAAALCRALMRSQRVQFFHDHVLVKEPGTSKPTPWHQDAPYYFVEGEQTASVWIPCDAVGASTLRFIAGSHRWPKLVRPVRWADDSDFYLNEKDYFPVPDPDRGNGEQQGLPPLTVLEWSLEPGDAVFFHFRTVHGARAHQLASRRRALSLRFVGDDARYVERPGRTSPPYPGHAMQTGQVLRTDWFPFVPCA